MPALSSVPLAEGELQDMIPPHLSQSSESKIDENNITYKITFHALSNCFLRHKHGDKQLECVFTDFCIQEIAALLLAAHTQTHTYTFKHAKTWCQTRQPNHPLLLRLMTWLEIINAIIITAIWSHTLYARTHTHTQERMIRSSKLLWYFRGRLVIWILCQSEDGWWTFLIHQWHRLGQQLKNQLRMFLVSLPGL